MIEYRDSEIAQILPDVLRSPEVKAVSYAINKALKQLLLCAEKASGDAAID